MVDATKLITAQFLTWHGTLLVKSVLDYLAQGRMQQNVVLEHTDKFRVAQNTYVNWNNLGNFFYQGVVFFGLSKDVKTPDLVHWDPRIHKI